MNHHARIGTTTAMALLLHVGAVVVAEQWPVTAIPQSAGAPPEVVIFSTLDPDEPPQPQEDDHTPPPPPLEQVTASDFQDETPTPPAPPRRSDRSRPPLRRPADAPPSNLGSPNARVLALTAPRPEYPYEARRQRLTGSGVALFKINPATGAVLDVQMLRSTGNRVLDNATLTAFRRWRFRPGTPPTVQAPITYTLTGATF
jgi:periplasmic protein TonB